MPFDIPDDIFAWKNSGGGGGPTGGNVRFNPPGANVGGGAGGGMGGGGLGFDYRNIYGFDPMADQRRKRMAQAFASGGPGGMQINPDVIQRLMAMLGGVRNG